MTRDYWLGVATTPALAATGVAAYFAARTLHGWALFLVDPTRDYRWSLSTRCLRCGGNGPFVMWPWLLPEWIVAFRSDRLHRKECRAPL